MAGSGDPPTLGMLVLAGPASRLCGPLRGAVRGRGGGEMPRKVSGGKGKRRRRGTEGL